MNTIGIHAELAEIIAPQKGESWIGIAGSYYICRKRRLLNAHCYNSCLERFDCAISSEYGPHPSFYICSNINCFLFSHVGGRRDKMG